MKNCNGCTLPFPLDEYRRVRKDRYGKMVVRHDSKCMSCRARVARERRNAMKQRCVDYLGGACVDCGYNRCLAAMDFHHVEPEHKDFEIGRYKQREWSKLKIELDKCVLVCRNCHAERHFNSSR